MTQLTDTERNMLDSIARSRPDFREFISSWRQAELERLALVSDSLFGAQKGRVALLTEMQQFLSLPKP